MKLRELLGIPGVHVFMLVHTLAGGYRAVVGYRARDTSWMANENVCMWPCICVPLHGNSGRSNAPSYRGRARARNARGERKRYSVTTTTTPSYQRVAAIRSTFTDSWKNVASRVHRKWIFHHLPRNSCRDENYRFSIGFPCMAKDRD